MKRFIVLMRVLMLLHLIPLVICMVLRELKWDTFYWYVIIISAALFTAVSRLLRVWDDLHEKAGRERWFHCIKNVGAALFILAVNFLLAYSAAERSPSPVGFYRSADGRHELVIIKYAYLGEVYSARPSKHHILYGDQPDDIVFSSFDKPASDIQVRWLNDGSARVYFIYDPTMGPVEEDSMLVSFD